MSKKGQAVQLQTEVHTDEEWEKLLERHGLIVVDIYSDWCGPCSAMAANLKKLKLEIGGDNLQLAVARCDEITCLERFREKSEPTWMFITHGKMINLMFGANAPKLIVLITNELKRMAAKKVIKEDAGEETVVDDRAMFDPSELSDEEQARYDVVERETRESRRIEKEKADKELLERRTKEADQFLNSLSDVGVILAWPHCRDKALEALQETFEHYQLVVNNKDKTYVKKTDLEPMFYFGEDDFQFDEESVENLISAKALALLVKLNPPNVLPEGTANIDEYVLQAIYGKSKKPPGSPESPAITLTKVKEPTEGTDEVRVETIGLWCPPNPNSKAMAIKMLFPKIAAPLTIPEPEPIPPHIVMAFDAFKRTDVLELAKEYPEEVMRYGFFTDEVAETAKLIAKTMPLFEKKAAETTFGEKLIIQLSKKRSDPVLAFAQLGPSYMSNNAVEGARECKLFFPEGYDIVEEEVVEEKKKPSRKMKKGAAAALAADKMKSDTDEPTEQNEAPLPEGEEKPQTEGDEVLVEVQDGEAVEGEEDILGEDEYDLEEGFEEMDKGTSMDGDQPVEGEPVIEEVIPEMPA